MKNLSRWLFSSKLFSPSITVKSDLQGIFGHMNKIFKRLNIFIRTVWLRDSLGLIPLLVSKFFDLCKVLINTIIDYHLPCCRFTLKNWKQQLQHHLYVVWHGAAVFLMIIFTLEFPISSFKDCIVNDRMCLVNDPELDVFLHQEQMQQGHFHTLPLVFWLGHCHYRWICRGLRQDWAVLMCCNKDYKK